MGVRRYSFVCTSLPGAACATYGLTLSLPEAEHVRVCRERHAHRGIQLRGEALTVGLWYTNYTANDLQPR